MAPSHPHTPGGVAYGACAPQDYSATQRSRGRARRGSDRPAGMPALGGDGSGAAASVDEVEGVEEEAEEDDASVPALDEDGEEVAADDAATDGNGGPRGTRKDQAPSFQFINGAWHNRKGVRLKQNNRLTLMSGRQKSMVVSVLRFVRDMRKGLGLGVNVALTIVRWEDGKNGVPQYAKTICSGGLGKSSSVVKVGAALATAMLNAELQQRAEAQAEEVRPADPRAHCTATSTCIPFAIRRARAEACEQLLPARCISVLC